MSLKEKQVPVLISVLCLLSCALATPAPAQGAELSAASRAADLQAMNKWVEIEASFDDAGKRFAKAQLETDRSAQQPERTRPWRRLLRNPVAGEDGAWAVVDAANPPLAFEEPEKPFRYIYLASEKVAYIQLRSNIDQGDLAIWDFAKSVEGWLKRDTPQAIILDNRFNPGGDLQRTAKLALSLPTLVPDHGAVYVLTSNATFSAGIYTSFFPKATDPKRTFVLGEHVGDRSRFFAESRGAFVLPNSGYRIGQSLQRHNLAEGCPESKICHLAGRRRTNIAVGDLEPDVVIATDFQDFIQSRDPVLEHALAAAAERVRSGDP